MNIRDCAGGQQTNYSYSASLGIIELPQTVCDSLLNAIAAQTDGKTAYASLGKFNLINYTTMTTIFNPMNAPIHIRVQVITPIKDLTQRYRNHMIDAATTYPDFKPGFIDANYMDLPYMTERYRELKKYHKTFWLQPGKQRTIKIVHVGKKGLLVNTKEGRFQTTQGGAQDDQLFAEWKGITKCMILTLHGGITQNSENTAQAIAQATYAPSRMIVGTRSRVVFKPIVFAGGADTSLQQNIYTQGFYTTYSNSGVPIMPSMYRQVKLDDDDLTPSGMTTTLAIATGDQRVQTHNT